MTLAHDRWKAVQSDSTEERSRGSSPGQCPWVQCTCPIRSLPACEKAEGEQCILVAAARDSQLALREIGHLRRLLGLRHVLEGSPPDDSLAELTLLKELTLRQREILREILGGRRVGAIAQNLHISPHTVRNHVSAIFAKVGVQSQGALVEKYRRVRELV